MALSLYFADSKSTNICVKVIQWGKLWYDFPGEQAAFFFNFQKGFGITTLPQTFRRRKYLRARVAVQEELSPWGRGEAISIPCDTAINFNMIWLQTKLNTAAHILTEFAPNSHQLTSQSGRTHTWHLLDHEALVRTGFNGWAMIHARARALSCSAGGVLVSWPAGNTYGKVRLVK